MNNAIVGNKYIVKGFHEESARFIGAQHWVGKVVECLYSDGEGVSGGDPDNTCACKIKDLETGEEIYTYAVYLEEYKEMKKLITEPIDFTGCIPEVADALKKGLKVKTDLGWITGYDGEDKLYCINDGGDEYLGWRYSDDFTLRYEKQTETRVKRASEIVKWLEDNGYEVDEDGDWDKVEAEEMFTAGMFQFCGKVPNNEYTWLPDWIEEVEV